MVKCWIPVRNYGVERYSSARPTHLHNASKLNIQEDVISLTSLNIKTEYQSEPSAERSADGTSDKSIPGSSKMGGKSLSPKLASMLEKRRMQLKIHRVSPQSASGVVWKPTRTSASKPRTLQTTERVVNYSLKPKTSSSSSVCSLSPKILCRQWERRLGYGSRSRLAGYAKSKKCSITSGRLSFSPPLSQVKKAADTTVFKASTQCADNSSTCGMLETAPSPAVKRRGRPRKSAVSRDSRHIVGSALVGSHDVRHAESDLYHPAHSGQELRTHRGQGSESKDMNPKDNTGMHSVPVVAARDLTVSLQAEEVARARSLTPEPDEKLSLSSSEQLAGKTGKLDIRNRRGNLKRRVGRPRKYSVEVGSSYAIGFPTKVLEPPAAQDHSARADLPLTNRADHLKRRVGRPRKHPAPEVNLSNVAEVPVPPAAHSLLSHTDSLWKNVQRKRKVGRPRKHQVPELRPQANSEEPGRREVHGQLSYADSPRTEMHESVSDAASDCRSRPKYGKASRMTAQKEFPASQATANSSGLPKQAGNASGSPFETRVMAVIYPCQEMSAHFPSEMLSSAARHEKAHTGVREPSSQEVLKEDHCDGSSKSSVDQSVNQEIDGASAFPGAPHYDSQKRRCGRLKERRYRPKIDTANLSHCALVSAISSASNNEQIVPQQAVDDQTTHQHVSKEVAGATIPGEINQRKREFTSHDGTQPVHENSHNVLSPSAVPDALKRGPGRPAKRRRHEDVTTSCSIASAAKPRAAGGYVSSHCSFPSVRDNGHIFPSSSSALGSDAPKSESERPEKRLRMGDVMTPGGLTSSAKPRLVGNGDQVVPEKPEDYAALNRQESQEIRTSSTTVRTPRHSSAISSRYVNMPAHHRMHDIITAFSPVVQLERLTHRQIEITFAKRTGLVQGDAERPASMEPGLAHDDGIFVPYQTERCMIGSRISQGKKQHSHVATSQGKEKLRQGRQTSDVRCNKVTGIERRTLRRPARTPRHPSPTVRTGSEIQQKKTAVQRGGDVAAAGGKSLKSGEEAYLGSRVPQVKLLPLAVALRLELASQNSQAGDTGVGQSASGQQTTVKREEIAPPESSVREDELSQDCTAAESVDDPPEDFAVKNEPQWMERSRSQSGDFIGFEWEDLQMHARKAACPEVSVKDSREGSGSEESRPGVSPATAVLSSPAALPGLERHRCDYCNFESSFREKLEYHARRRHGYLTEKRRYACKKCSYSSNCAYQLRVHNRKHTGEKPFPCSVCGKRFSYKQARNAHILIHTDKKPFTCETCGRACRTAVELRYHQKIHTEERHYHCDVCGKAFKFQYMLERHERVHSGEKPFPCSLCGKCFSRKSSLVRHGRLHSGERPYRCDVCGKEFAYSSVYRYHAYTHQEERNFKCDCCGKFFKAKKFLDFHMRIHTGEKKHMCASIAANDSFFEVA